MLVPPQKKSARVESQWIYVEQTLTANTLGGISAKNCWSHSLPSGVEGSSWRTGTPFGSPSPPCSVPSTHFWTEQARRLDFQRRALATNFACLTTLFLLFRHSSPHFFPFVSFSPYQLSLSRPIVSSMLPLCSFGAANSPVFLTRWKGERVFHQDTASGTFQLACIPASGCVRDKMEQIPPGYCYLCFPAVTHKQAYTFPHMHSHMSLHARKMPVRQLPVLQMHRTDSSPTRGGQAF